MYNKGKNVKLCCNFKHILIKSHLGNIGQVFNTDYSVLVMTCGSLEFLEFKQDGNMQKRMPMRKAGKK